MRKHIVMYNSDFGLQPSTGFPAHEGRSHDLQRSAGQPSCWVSGAILRAIRALEHETGTVRRFRILPADAGAP